MKNQILFGIILVGLTGWAGAQGPWDQNPLLFQSLESVTEDGAPVFNKVSFIFGWKQDIWLMNQTHHGLELEKEKWDRLAIVVDKSVTPKVARFYQLAPGDSPWIPGTQAVPFKARCLACHSGGPRAIRAEIQSLAAPLTWAQKAKIGFWNFRIKSYGFVQNQAGHAFENGVPFISKLKILSKPLGFKSCTGCHSPGGLRGELTLGQVGTVAFMVRNQLMPPFPFKISKEDQETLQNLLTQDPST
ncbi:MAG: hypothetical protein ACK5P7_10050 [Bdellovibrio sp.]